MDNETVGIRFRKALELKYGARNNPIIANKYEFAPQTIGQLKKKKAINETIASICEKENINLNWIQSGKGHVFIENDISENYVTTQNGNGNLALNGKQIHININKDDIEIIEYFKKLTPKQQQYYSHLIKADVLKEEMENETKDIIK